MKLPFAFIVGKSLDELAQDSLKTKGLAQKIDLCSSHGCQDRAIRGGYAYLPVVERLYKESVPQKQRGGSSHTVKDKVTVLVHSYDGTFPNQAVAPNEGDGPFNKQHQVLISPKLLLARDIHSIDGKYVEPWADTKYASGSLFTVHHEIVKPVSEAFVREMLSDPSKYFVFNDMEHLRFPSVNESFNIHLLTPSCDSWLYRKTVQPALRDMGYEVTEGGDK